MVSAHRLAEVAAALAEPSRAAMLLAMLDGSAHPASDLATCARVTPATASEHLARLVSLGLLRVEPRGRQRWFRLAHGGVAEAIEALGRLVPPSSAREQTPARAALRAARLCYDHLAGRLGVELFDALVAKRWLRRQRGAWAPTPAGEAALTRRGIDIAGLRDVRRPIVRACLDWTERREHLAGALGAALAAHALEQRWVVRLHEPRALRVTEAGARALGDWLGMRDLHGA